MKRMPRACLLLLVFGFAVLQPFAAKHAWAAKKTNEPAIEISIRSSQQASFRTVILISSKRWMDWLNKLEPVEPDSEPASPVYDIIELTVSKGNTQPVIYEWRSDGILRQAAAESNSSAFRPPQAMSRALVSLCRQLRQAHYGKAAAWPEANRLLPKGSVMSITDLETGLTFKGQRRAGSAHADVQPLTKEDSKIMKAIYGGKWSWNRRAVLVLSPEGPVGGSMHGMPHGGDGIAGNDFNGHFCIHYKDSTTHGSGHADPAHQAMVHKASGQLETYHKQLTSLEALDLFLIASSQKDPHLLQMLLNQDAAEHDALLQEWLDPALQTARRIDKETNGSPEAEAQQLQIRLRTRVSLWRTGARPQAVWLHWTLSRPSASQGWTIGSIQPEAVIR